MLIEKPQCNFKNCRYCFDGNCFSANKYENCKLTDLHCEIAKLRVDLDNAKAEVEEYKHNWQKIHDSYTADCIDHYNRGRTEVAREIFEEIEKYMMDFVDVTHTAYKTIGTATFAELKKKYTEDKT